MTKDQVFVEPREKGDFAVRKANSKRASAVEPTQAEAIDRAKELEPHAKPSVARVRDTGNGKPDKFRKS